MPKVPKVPASRPDYPAIFQEIWAECRRIPKGNAATYGYLALKINRPGAARVVAMAMAKNPFAPRVPCHRVVRADGAPGGYSAPGGLLRKIHLLKREGVRFVNGRVHPDDFLR